MPAISELGLAFGENQYGMVKRLEVIGGWTRDIAAWLGKPCLTILDVGCGTGDHLTFPLARAGHQVVGLDVHAASIEEACGRYSFPRLSFRTGSIEDLIRDRLTFDIVVCSEVLEHLVRPGDLLATIPRVLRPGGWLIVTTPNGYGSFELLCRLERALRRTGVHQPLHRGYVAGRGLVQRLRRRSALERPAAAETTGFLNWDSVHVQLFRLGRLERLFCDCGFRVVARRARTLLCGPYVDVMFALCPWRQVLFRLNNRLADRLPFAWAADWMFLLKPEDGPRA